MIRPGGGGLQGPQVWYRYSPRHAWRLAGYAGAIETARRWADELRAEKGWLTYAGEAEPSGRKLD